MEPSNLEYLGNLTIDTFEETVLVLDECGCGARTLLVFVTTFVSFEDRGGYVYPISVDEEWDIVYEDCPLAL